MHAQIPLNETQPNSTGKYKIAQKSNLNIIAVRMQFDEDGKDILEWMFSLHMNYLTCAHDTLSSSIRPLNSTFTSPFSEILIDKMFSASLACSCLILQQSFQGYRKAS